jgi:uncharacterized cofD-like protein
VSRDHDLVLKADLNDGRRIEGQHLITGLAEEEARVGIRSVFLEGADANPEASSAIGAADAVVYGPGSFFTSILPHLLVAGVAEALAKTAAPKILIGNMLEDRETRGQSLGEMVDRLRRAGRDRRVLTHLVAHEGAVPLERVIGASRFVRRGPEPSAEIAIIARDLEDPWHRGMHDAGLLSAVILDIARKGV